MTERGYLGEVLEELRLERGLSLRDLAEKAGLTKSYLSQMESGKQKNPSLEKLRGLAAALGVSITVVRDEPGYIRVSEGSPEDRSHVRSGAPTIREELDEAKDETHFKPDWASPPGDTIADILEERGLTPEDLAVRTGLSVEFVEELLKGRAVITPEVAAELQRALGSTVEFWLAREANYRKALAGEVAIGVDHGAGPDRQVVTVWHVSDIGKYPPNFKELLSVDAAIDPNAGNLNPYEKAVAERMLAELEAYKPPLSDQPPPSVAERGLAVAAQDLRAAIMGVASSAGSGAVGQRLNLAVVAADFLVAVLELEVQDVSGLPSDDLHALGALYNAAARLCRDSGVAQDNVLLAMRLARREGTVGDRSRDLARVQPDSDGTGLVGEE